MKQRGFTLLIYAALAIVVLAMLGGIYWKGYSAGKETVRAEWLVANFKAQEVADWERRGREADAAAQQKKLDQSEAIAANYRARYENARRNVKPSDLAVIDCPAASPQPQGATIGIPPATQVLPEPRLRLSYTFGMFYDAAWTSQDGQPVFDHTAELAQAAPSPGAIAHPGFSVENVLDNHAENAARCSVNARAHNALIDLLEKLRAR